MHSPIRLDDCWAKTDPATDKPALTVRDHCLIVGAVAEVLYGWLPKSKRATLPAGAATLVALHDIGKLTFGFQSKCDSWTETARERGIAVNRLRASCGNHALISEIDFRDRQPNAGEWAKALGGHHGRFPSNQGNEHHRSFRLFRPLRNQLYQELSQIFGEAPSSAPPGEAELLEFPHVSALCGFMILCDWLGSDEENFPLPDGAFGPTRMKVSDAREKAEAAIRRRGLIQQDLRNDTSFDELFTPENADAFTPNELQRICHERINGPGLYLIEAPMGMGKTEAALYSVCRLISSGKASGLYFALPTQLTSNKIHERVASFVSRAMDGEAPLDLALAHSAAWLKNPLDLRITSGSSDSGDPDRTDARAARSWFTSRRALLARYGVGTIDQALMGALPVKFAALRLYGLSGKVVIFDEVHTYDAYTARILDRLIDHLLALRCTVLILSATLTRERRVELVARAAATSPEPPADYPLLTCCPAGSPTAFHPIPYPASLPSHEIRLRRISLEDESLPESLVDEIMERAESGHCVLVIRNTVALAQDTFSCLKREGIETGLLHSRFPSHVRNGHPDSTCQDPDFPEGRESAWIAKLGTKGPRPTGCVLVTTQVAEQSLDIDADLLVTDLCPADMLVQRIGRLWRHMSHRPAEKRPCPHPETWLLTPRISPEMDAEALDHALRPHSRIYAPYVLLRTLAALFPDDRETGTVAIPSGIRDFLEAVYAGTETAEPESWKELRDAMNARTKMLLDKSNLLTANPYFPPTDDAEFAAPTRYRDFPTIDLILLRATPKTLPGGEIELRFHSGETLRWHPAQGWSFPIARAAFLSTVRVPRYQITPEPPAEWLLLHAHGPVAAGVIDESGRVYASDGDTPLGFRYEPDRGLLRDPEALPSIHETSNPEELDETLW